MRSRRALALFCLWLGVSARPLRSSPASGFRVVAPNASACGARYRWLSPACPLKVVKPSYRRVSCYGGTDAFDGWFYLELRGYNQSDAVRLCQRVGAEWNFLAGLAQVSDSNEWRLMERACSSQARDIWTGIKATLDSRGSASLPGVRWVQTGWPASRRVVSMPLGTPFNASVSALPDDGFLNRLVSEPDWVDARCNCGWDAGYPKDVLHANGSLTANVCVYLYNPVCVGTPDGEECNKDAPGPPAARNRQVFLRNGPCDALLGGACCEYIPNPAAEDKMHIEQEYERTNRRPRFTEPSWPENTALDVRVADRWPPGTVLVSSFRAFDPDDDDRKTSNSPLGGLDVSITQLRLLPPDIGAAPPPVYVDVERGALVYNGSDASGTTRSRAPPSYLVRVAVLDMTGCEGAVPLTLRVSVLPSYELGGAGNDTSAATAPPSGVVGGGSAVLVGLAAQRRWAPNSPPLFLLSAPLRNSGGDANASLWPLPLDASTAVSVLDAALQGRDSLLSRLLWDADSACAAPSALAATNGSGGRRTCPASASTVRARVEAASSTGGTAAAYRVRLEHRTNRSDSGSEHDVVVDATIAPPPASVWALSAAQESFVVTVQLRACDGMGGCTDSAVSAAHPDGIVGPDAVLTYVVLACDQPCGDLTPFQAAACVIGADQGRRFHNRLCLTWAEAVFGRPQPLLFRSSPSGGGASSASPPGWLSLLPIDEGLSAANWWAVVARSVCAALLVAWVATQGALAVALACRAGGAQPPPPSSLHADVHDAPPSSGGGATDLQPQRGGLQAQPWGANPLAAARRKAPSADEAAGGDAPRSAWAAVHAERALARSHACTAFTAAALVLVCAFSITVALPTAAARPDVSQPRMLERLRPAGKPWRHAAVPPLTAQQLARVQDAVPDAVPLPGAPAVPSGAWPALLGVTLLLCILARLALPLSVIHRLFIVGGAELRSLQLDALFVASPFGEGGGGERGRRLGAWSSVVRLGSTPLSHALWQLAYTARYYAPVLRAARWTLVAALVAPSLFYTESFLAAAARGIFREALRRAEGKKEVAVVGVETRRYAEALCVSRVRDAVRGDVLLAFALTDLPLVVMLLVLLSPALLRADSPLVALFHVAVAVHVACLALMRAPWRALPLLAAVARGDGSSASAPSEAALAAMRAHLAANGSVLLWLLPRLSARLAHRWLCAYALVNAGALHLSPAAAAVEGSPEASGSDVAAEEVGGPPSLLAMSALSPGAGGAPPPPSSAMHARIHALLAGRKPLLAVVPRVQQQQQAAASDGGPPAASASAAALEGQGAAMPAAGPPPDAAPVSSPSGADAAAARAVPPPPPASEAASTFTVSVANGATTTTTTITTVTTTTTPGTGSGTAVSPVAPTKDLAIGYTTATANPLAGAAASAAALAAASGGATTAPPAAAPLVPPPPPLPVLPPPAAASVGVKVSSDDGEGRAPGGGAAGGGVEKVALEYGPRGGGGAASAAPASPAEGREKVALDFTTPAR